MATPTTAIFPTNHVAPIRRHHRGNPRGLGLAVPATVGLYLALPVASEVLARTAAPLGGGAVGLLALVGFVAGCGAAGWFLRSWWLPLVAPLPGLAGAFLFYRMMVTADDPDAGFLVFAVMGLLGMGLVIAVGTTIGVVVGKLTRAA
ncbi:MAG TPA: hypothetical protein VH482_13830 [Thermomicrobiales bacterium]|jgi:hypothetical protein